MTVMHRPLPLSHDRLEQVLRAGAVDLGSFAQPQLLAADLDLASSTPEGRELKSTFEQLDPDEQQRAIEAARAHTIDPQAHAVMARATGDPLVRGAWYCTPPWFRPLSASGVSTLLGAALPDGSMASLEAAADLVNSQVTVTVRTLPDQADHLADGYFAADPAVPPDVTPSEGWTDETGGGLAMLTLVWPRGRGVRAVQWRITRLDSTSDTALLETRRDYGRKRSVDQRVTRVQFAHLLQDMLEESWAQAR
jgi:hypothetical protein